MTWSAAALAATLLAAAPAGELDRVVAVVRPPGASAGHVITLSALEAETRVALVARGGTLAATQPLDPATLRAGLDNLVDETLVAAEASRLEVFETTDEDRAAEVARFTARLGGPAAYRAFLARAALSDEELGAALTRSLRVRRYLASRVANAARVSEAEVSAWLDEHAAALGARDREAAREQLSRQRAADEAAALLRELRARSEIRLLALPGGAAGQGS